MSFACAMGEMLVLELLVGEMMKCPLCGLGLRPYGAVNGLQHEQVQIKSA